MIPDRRKRAYKMDMLLAVALVTAGLTMSGVSLVRLSAENTAVAQATPPLQSTPGAENKSSAPTTTGTRPNEIPPQPARPDAEAQKAGATPALPPAPAEKTAAPIQQK